MAPDDAVVEGFAMKAEELSQSSGDLSVPLKELGEAVGLSQEDTNNVARLLQSKGWATINYQATPRLWLTALGFSEVRKLRLPPLRKWIDRHPGLVGAITASSVGLVAAILAEAIKKLLWP